MDLSTRGLLQRRIGAALSSSVNRVVSSVGAAVVTVLKQDPSRVQFLFVNLGANTIFLAPLGTPSANNGILVAPNGGSVVLNWEEDGEVVGWEWQAVAPVGNSAIMCLETILERVAPPVAP